MDVGDSQMRLWVFTEHRNATFVINFAAPIALQRGPSVIAVESWSSDEIECLGLTSAQAQLTAHAARAHPSAAVFSRYVNPFGVQLIEHVRSRGGSGCPNRKGTLISGFLPEWLR